MKKIFKSLLWFPVFALAAVSCSSEKISADLPEAQNSAVIVTTDSNDLSQGVKLDGNISLSVPATRAGIHGIALHLVANSTADFNIHVSGTVEIDGEGVEIEDIIPLFAKDEVLSIDNEDVTRLLENDPDSIVIKDIVIRKAGGKGNDDGDDNDDLIGSITVSLEGVVTVPMV